MEKESATKGVLSPLLRLMAILSLALFLVVPSVASAQSMAVIQADDEEATEEVEETPEDEEDATEPSDEEEEESTPEGDEEEAESDKPCASWDPEDYDPADYGLISDDEYESPLWGNTIEWGTGWSVDTYYDDPEESKSDCPSVWSDEEQEYDQLYLIYEGSGDSVSYVIFSLQSANRGGPEGDVEEWTDEDYIAEQWSEQFVSEAIDDQTTEDAGAVFYSVVDDDSGDQYYTLYQSITLEDGTTFYITFSSFEDSFISGYESFSEDVLFDGEPIELVYTAADLEEIIDAQ